MSQEKMPKFSKIGILIFLTLIISGGFTFSHFSKAENSGNDFSITNESNSYSGGQEDSNSFSESSVYICPNATSLEKINPRCPDKIILKLGETVEGLTLTTTIYEDQEYYLVLGFINGGGAVNLPPVANADGTYQGYGGLPITFDASNSSDPNSDPLQYRWDFENDGIWDTEWLNTPKAEHIWNNDYEGVVKLEVSDGEFTAIDTTSVKVKSQKTLKKETIERLESAKTDSRRIDQRIDWITKRIQESLDDELWIDDSHLVSSNKENCFNSKILEFNLEEKNLEKILEIKPNEVERSGCKSGFSVFLKEYEAVLGMLLNLKREIGIPEGLKLVFQETIDKLVKADQLLAKVAIYDAKNTPIKNPKLKKLVELQITKAEKELAKGEELAENQPEKAILRFAKAWLNSQLAIKFTNFKE